MSNQSPHYDPEAHFVLLNRLMVTLSEKTLTMADDNIELFSDGSYYALTQLTQFNYTVAKEFLDMYKKDNTVPKAHFLESIKYPKKCVDDLQETYKYIVACKEEGEKINNFSFSRE